MPGRRVGTICSSFRVLRGAVSGIESYTSTGYRHDIREFPPSSLVMSCSASEGAPVQLYEAYWGR